MTAPKADPEIERLKLRVERIESTLQGVQAAATLAGWRRLVLAALILGAVAGAVAVLVASS